MVTVVKKGASLKAIEDVLKKLRSRKALNARKHNGVIHKLVLGDTWGHEW